MLMIEGILGMYKHKSHCTLSLHGLTCSMIMQAGIIGLLIAQSFSATCQRIIIEGSILLLLGGGLFFVGPQLYRLVWRYMEARRSHQSGHDETPGYRIPGAIAGVSLIRESDSPSS
jgi:hypothetical protein